MQINKVCRKYGLSRKTIHFYIESGLLKPAKLNNNYYDFSDADIKKLELIIKLRNAGVSIENIDCIFKYPTCTNFFLFKQRFQLKKEIEKYNRELSNINTIIGNIPPNGTYFSVAEINSQLFFKKEETFDEIDEFLTSRMTATFLFTPFMGQKVDDYREFIWNKIVKITRMELNTKLKEISSHLSSLDGWTVDHFSSALAQLFISLSKDKYEETYNYLKNEIDCLLNLEEYQNKWALYYKDYIVPFKNILSSCHSILKEYNQFYTDCMDRFPLLVQKLLKETDIDRLKKMDFDIDNEPFNDFFILFCFRYSVFISPFLSSPEECDNYLRL